MKERGLERLVGKVGASSLLALSLAVPIHSQAEEFVGKALVGITWDKSKVAMSHYAVKLSKNGSPFIPVRENGLNNIHHDSWLNGDSYVEISLDPSAVNRIRVVGIDSLGEESEPCDLEVQFSNSDWFHFKPGDVNPPEVNIISNEVDYSKMASKLVLSVDDESYFLSPKFLGGAKLLASRQISRKSQTGRSSEFEYNLLLSKQRNELEFMVVDTFGNRAFKVVQVNVTEEIPPILNIVENQEKYFDRDINLSGNLSDNIGLREIRVEGDVELKNICYGNMPPYYNETDLQTLTNVNWNANLVARLIPEKNTSQGYVVDYKLIGVDRFGNQTINERRALINNGIDSDGDGIDDFHEIYYGGTSRGYDPNNKDTDRDGMGDNDERLAGFDPSNPNSNYNLRSWKAIGLEGQGYFVMSFNVGINPVILERGLGVLPHVWEEVGMFYNYLDDYPVWREYDSPNGDLERYPDFEQRNVVAGILNQELLERGAFLQECDLIENKYDGCANRVTVNVPDDKNYEFYRLRSE
jgi:hypothetical protein